jgi:cell division protein ZapA
MSEDSIANTLNIEILGKDYRVGCPEGEEENLRSAARHLDKQMHDIKRGGKIIGTEKIAVMVALNLANDLLQLDRIQDQKLARTAQKVEALTKKVEQILLDIKD